MGAVPQTLSVALRPVTLVVGHYGTGKTNFAVNLAIDLVAVGKQVAVIDLDIVNPYFRASEQRRLLEEHGVELVAPVFAEVGTSLDVPSLTGKVAPAIEAADFEHVAIVDVGGDDAGSVALGRYARVIRQRDYAMLAVANRYRNLVQDPVDALQNLREIEAACGLRATAVVDNSHLKASTDAEVVRQGIEHAVRFAALAALPLVAVTVPPDIDCPVDPSLVFPIEVYVKTPWE